MNDQLCSQWLQRAKSNLIRVKLGRLSPDVLYEDLCFDAQQAAEKSLKALMIYLGVAVPRTHSIGYLLRLIRETGKVTIPETLNEAVVLTDYAVTTRYPGEWEPVVEDEYNDAANLAQEIFEWVTGIVFGSSPGLPE